MFKFLKEKIRQAVSSISKKVEEDATIEETAVEQVQTKPELKEEKVAAKQKDVAKEKVLERERAALPDVEIKTGLELPAILQEDIKIKKVEEELKAKEPEAVEEAPKEKKKGFFARLFEKKEEIKEEKPEAIEKKAAEISKEEPVTEEPKKKGFFGSIKEKIVTKKIDDAKFEELFFDLEFALLENNVAYEVVSKIKDDLRRQLVDKPLPRGKLEEVILESLKKSIDDILSFEPVDLIKKIKEKKEKPFVIVFVGINGSGKTTSVAKVAHLLKKNGLSVVLAAGDTYRAAGSDQLIEWGNRLGAKVIAKEQGADSASVAFDGRAYCKAHNIDVLLVDTAGRQHSNENLMREMEKIIRVAQSDMKIFVGESLTGGDIVLQSQEFNKSIGLDGIILTKSDIDEKGGAVISASYIIKKPILYLGIGQSLDDLKPFDKDYILKNLGL